jgi:very-short-patch-repair endonuclease
MPLWTCRECGAVKPKVSMRRTKTGLYMDMCTDCKPSNYKPPKNKTTVYIAGSVISKKRSRGPSAFRAMFKASARLKGFAKQMRERMTPAERHLWERLCRVGDWESQVVIGGFIADFYSPTLRTAIEVDGSIHNLSHVQERDKLKEWKWSVNGIKTLRFTNERVFADRDRVLSELPSPYGDRARLSTIQNDRDFKA